jgi:1-deoxyxylulose-5-phosphate synthase
MRTGTARRWVGRAVCDVRERMFVIDKIDQLNEPVAPQVDASLHRLGLEWADLFVFHNLSTVDAWAKICSPGGGMDQLDSCRRAGKLRFLGISSHDPATLREAIPSGLCSEKTHGLDTDWPGAAKPQPNKGSPQRR